MSDESWFEHCAEQAYHYVPILQSGNAALKARIEELEDALKEYAKGSNWSSELDLGDSTKYLANSCIWKDNTQDGSITARNALGKESD